MENLEKYLRNHEEDELKSLIDMPISDLTGILECNTMSEVLTKYVLYTPLSYNYYNANIIWLVNYENEYNKYKWYTQYLGVGSIFFLLIFPIVVSNYWLYFGLLLLPIGLMASSIYKTPFYNFFWIIVILLIVSSFYFAQYSMLGVVVLNVLFMRGLKMGKMFYRDTLIRAATRSEICFKYLYHIGMIQLYNRK